ncbi:MAG: NAD-dependent epimerase/dehydratase family protein [Dongiaceae bacterium]
MTEPRLADRRIILVTGGLGFIGKTFVRRALEHGHFVINIDAVNYAADRKALKEFQDWDTYRFITADIAALQHLPECDFLVNFAAESHVDNSIDRNLEFCRSNFLGPHRLLELIRARRPQDRPRFIQIGTDEVYGDIAVGRHSETDPLRPSNPYSASKAAADMLVLGWWRTYGIDYNILRISNNYGPHQYPEKLIPKSSARMLRGLPALMHGDGSYLRSWLHVEDTVDAIIAVMARGERCTIYNVCGDLELSVIDAIRKIARLLSIPEQRAYIAVEDRAGQDLRYSMDDSRIRRLDWRPRRDFDLTLREIVQGFEFDRFI